jgi:hypothetical protein
MVKAPVNLSAAFGNTFHIDVKCLFLDLLWPAAAGNVAWAVAQVAVGHERSQSVASRLIVLVLLAVYLAIDWSRSKSQPTKKKRYWVGDTFHLISIVAFAVAVADNDGEIAEWSLAAVFSVGVVGHLSGLWEIRVGETTQKTNWGHRFCLAGCGLLGIAVLVVARVGFRMPLFRRLPVAFLIVFVAWIVVRVGIESQRRLSTDVVCRG